MGHIYISYYGPETRVITKLFKNTNIGISYRTKTNIKHHLEIKRNATKNDKYNLSGVYELQCTECPRKYIGQTGRTFKAKYKEHIRDIKNNGQYSKFAQHVVETGHQYGNMEETMKILHIEKKSQILNTYEMFYVYNIRKQNIQLNDTFAETHKRIYDTILPKFPT
jgi:hypothetical protein